MKLLSSLLFVLLSTALCQSLAASNGGGRRKGCRLYGHSCFGGHGKRSVAVPLDQQQLSANIPDPEEYDQRLFRALIGFKAKIQKEDPIQLIQRLRKWIEAHPNYTPDNSGEYN